MFARKHSATAGTELRAAAEQAFMVPAALIADGQASGEVVDGDPARIGFVAFAAMQGVATFISSGLVTAEMAETAMPDITTQILNGLRPRP
jgi:hypothetical protein